MRATPIEDRQKTTAVVTTTLDRFYVSTEGFGRYQIRLEPDGEVYVMFDNNKTGASNVVAVTVPFDEFAEKFEKFVRTLGGTQ